MFYDLQSRPRRMKGTDMTATTPAGAQSPGGDLPVLDGAVLPEQLSASPGFLLSKAAEIVTAHFSRALKPYGINPREYGVLAFITEHGPQSQQRIGERLNIDRTTMVNIIDDMESSGLVARLRDSTDRRRYAITMTDKGETLVDTELGRINRVAHDDFLSVLSSEESKVLIELLHRLVTVKR